MYKIFVENIRCHSFHGCLPEETIIGGNYRVDVIVLLNNEKLKGNDDLNQTIDYCEVTKIVEDHMSVPCKLIETVCEKICDSVIKVSKKIQEVSGNFQERPRNVRKCPRERKIQEIRRP